MKTREELEAQFLNGEKFYMMVNDISISNHIPYMESIMYVCDNNGIDPEDLVKLQLISPLLKCKLEEESIAAGLLKETSKLPI